MNQFNKKFLASFCALTLTCASITNSTFASEKNLEIENSNSRAWPGRPGGNGDGSEEWLQGSYGQTNGEFKRLYSSNGNVSSLNTRKSVADSIGLGIVSLLSGNIFTGTAGLVSGGFVTAVGIAGTIYDSYSGNYYRSATYISGRCMKTIIRTYKYSNYTGYVSTYTKYTKW